MQPAAAMLLPYAIQGFVQSGCAISDEEALELSEEDLIALMDAGDAIMNFVERNLKKC